jgi:pimeloyl-ACP methyl ester carboxylesterase
MLRRPSEQISGIAPVRRPFPGERDEITFSSRGTECAAWLYQPKGPNPAPCVILAHGFDGVRDQRLDEYAARFAAAGIAAFVFDYRYFGDSCGEPRQLVSNNRQLDDWRAAIEHVRTDARVDEKRIALWGTSTSGGHVVKVAAEYGDVAAVVVQMPFADGFAQFRCMPITQSLRLLWAGLRDQLQAWVLPKHEPLLIPAGGRPRSWAVSTTPDAVSGLAHITPCNSNWRNEVTARFALTTTLYRPGLAARRLQCPLMVCVADDDRLIAIKPAVKMAERAERGTLRRYPFGHFGMYYGEGFDRVVPDQVAFLRQHLLEKAAA